jgi:type II secretory pathway predicted ATPase ExeA
MYEAFFGLSSPPFGAAPQAARYVPTTALEDARQSLARCLQRGSGAGLVIGPAGTGKSLLLEVLATSLRADYRVVLIEGGRLSTRRALLQSVLFELGQPFRDLDEGELRLALIDYLTSHPSCPHGMALLVDEAHVLPLRLLEEIRLIANLARGGEPRVRVALAGTATLEERFASGRLELFSQRLAARCYLSALNRQETEHYVRRRIELAGGDSDLIFAPDAVQSVYQATDGVPRLINQVCDHALLLACVSGQRMVDSGTIDEAWADLQQLPSPWSRGRENQEGRTGVVEFGQLEEFSGEPSSVPFRMPAAKPETASEEEFVPAGSIGPEVELVIDSASDPFREPFAEEELIIDRCARLQADNLRKMQAMPGDWTVTRPQANASPLAGPAAQLEPEGAAQHLAASIMLADDVADPVLPIDVIQARLRELMAEHDRQIGSGLSGGHAAKEQPDEDLIVVEEHHLIPLPPPLPKAQPVRQNQFGQLFARLRHG